MMKPVQFRFAAALVVAVTSGGCATVGSSIAAALGFEESDPSTFGPSSRTGNGTASVYQVGPTPDWQIALRTQPSAARAEVFEAWLFDGACPGIALDLEADADPYERYDRVGSFLRLGSSHSPGSSRGLFDPVQLGGMTPQVQAWQGLDPQGLAGGGCRAPGFPLIAFGKGGSVLVNR